MTTTTLSAATSPDDIAEQVRSVNGPLRIIGGGTRTIGSISGHELSLSGLTGITLYEPGAMTMVARAGTTVEEIEKTLAEEGQRLAFEPSDWRSLLGTSGNSTIGGLAAANISGPRRIQVGACRDHIIGVEFVDGSGRLLKNGGRVMKNVTGYDLVKLMCGSWGTLGVLTELSFKVGAISEAEVTLVYEGLSDNDAVMKLCEVMSTPFDVSGSAHVNNEGVGKTCIRIEGLAASVMYRREALLNSVCSGFEVHEGDASKNLWQSIRDVSDFAGTDGAVWRVSLKPTDAAKLTGKLTEASIQHNVIYDWSGGLIWVLVKSEQAAAAELIRSTTAELKGHATLVRSESTLDGVPTFQPQNSIIQKLEGSLREKFDPRGILNKGLMS